MDATIQNGIALNPKSILTKVDTTPTADSNNPVSSDGVKTYVDQKDQATNSRVDTLTTQIAADFFFKGSSAFADLPASGNTVNDTYYVTDSDKECWYSWNGTEWVKSSMSQADYAGLIAQLKADVSAEYSTSKTYKVGDYCLYGADGVLYICKTAVTTAGAFDSSKWQAISFGEAVGDLVIADDTQPTSLANKIWLDTDPNPDTVEVITEEDLGNIVAGEFDSASAYAVGDYCTHDAKLYIAKTATAANDGWIAARWQQVTVMGTLNDEVGNLKESTSAEKTYAFTIGGLSTSSSTAGDETDNQARARTDFIACDTSGVEPGHSKYFFFNWNIDTSIYAIAFVFMYKDGIYALRTSTLNIENGIARATVSSSANQIRFVIKRVDGNNFTDSDIAAVSVSREETLKNVLPDYLDETLKQAAAYTDTTSQQIAENVVENASKNNIIANPLNVGYVSGQDIIPYKELTNLFNGMATTASFSVFYNKFHELYTTYAASNPGFEEINLSAQSSETMPQYIADIPNGAMYMWHIPPLPKNDNQGDATYNTIRLLVTSGIHGSEKNAIVTVYSFMERLLSGSDEVAVAFRNLDIYIIPLCNPYGINWKNSSEQYTGSSYNGNGININRDFPVENWQADTGDHSYTEPYSQYETKIIVSAINNIKPHVAIDHHCFTGNTIGATRRLYWGTSAFGATVSRMFEIFGQLNWEVKKAFPEKFGAYNFIYGYSRFVSATSGTLCRYLCEQGINGATVECPNTVRWSEEQGYIWDGYSDPQKELVSVASMYFINTVKMMVHYAEYVLNSGIEFEVED